MKTVINLVRKDFIRFRNDTPAVLLTFLVPIVLILIFANIFGGHAGPKEKIRVLFVNNSGSEAAKYMESRIDSSDAIKPLKKYRDEDSGEFVPLTVEKVKELITKGSYAAGLIIPEDFFADTSTSVKFKFYYDPRNEIEYALIQGELQRIIMSKVPKLLPVLMQRQAEREIGKESAEEFQNSLSKTISEYFGITEEEALKFSFGSENAFAPDDSAGEEEGSNMMAEMVKIESEQLVGEEISNPGVTRIIGGWAMMFLLFSLTGAATSLFEEKQEGSLKRVLCMPVKRSHLLWSKYIYMMALGFMQLMVMFLFGWAVYDVDIFSNFFNLVVVILASAGAAVAFGMIITSFAKSLSQANGIATLLILVMSAVGGSWFPVTFFPEWLQVAAKFTVTYWSVDAFLQVLWRDASFAAIAPNVLILLSIAFLVNFYSLLRFRQGKVIDE